MKPRNNDPEQNSEVSAEALEDIRNRVKPLLGIPIHGDLIIEKVATKHNLAFSRVVQIAKNMKNREKK